MRALSFVTDNDVQTPTSLTVTRALHCARGKKLRGCVAKVHSGEWVKICAGVYLESRIFEGRPVWDQRRMVSLARAFAVATTGQRVLAGLSAALTYDVPLLNDPENVAAYSRMRSGTVPKLESVTVDERLVMPTGHMVRRKLVAPDLVCRRDIGIQIGASVSTEMLPAALVTIACTQPPEDAFVALCMGLHQAAHSSHIRTAQQRQQVEKARHFLLCQLESLPKGTRGVHRARLLVEAADGGCDSVGEARLVWILKCAGIQGISTQHMVATPLNTYFVDVAIPSVKLAIEFDGFSKYALSPLVHQQWSDQNNREQAIKREGYEVHRFQWENFEHPTQMLADLDSQLARQGVGLPRVLTKFAKEFGALVR